MRSGTLVGRLQSDDRSSAPADGLIVADKRARRVGDARLWRACQQRRHPATHGSQRFDDDPLSSLCYVVASICIVRYVITTYVITTYVITTYVYARLVLRHRMTPAADHNAYRSPGGYCTTILCRIILKLRNCHRLLVERRCNSL